MISLINIYIDKQRNKNKKELQEYVVNLKI